VVEEERAAEEEARCGDLGGERGECDSGRESDRRGCLMRCVCYRQGACQGRGLSFGVDVIRFGFKLPFVRCVCYR
jgi:hypothetical protein